MSTKIDNHYFNSIFKSAKFLGCYNIGYAHVIGYCNLTKPFDLAFAIITKCDTIITIIAICID